MIIRCHTDPNLRFPCSESYVGQCFAVIGVCFNSMDTPHCVRILDPHFNCPVICPLNCFDILDQRVPGDWVCIFNQEGSYTFCPRKLSGNFWEEFENSKDEAYELLEKVIEEIYFFHNLKTNFKKNIHESQNDLRDSDAVKEKSIVIKIIEKNPFLIGLYYFYLYDITNNNIENASIDEQFFSLSQSFFDNLIKEKMPWKTIEDTLSHIESCLIDEFNKETYHNFSIFFSHLKGKFSKISEASEGYKFVRFFLNNLGPISQELYEGRNLFK